MSTLRRISPEERHRRIAPARVIRAGDRAAFPTPWRMIAGLCKHRELLWQLSRREVAARYRGSLAGILWTFLNPLIMLAAYTFVFGFIFRADKAHLTMAQMTGVAFDIFSGLICFNFLADCLARAPAILLGNVNYVKKVVFPLEVLACSTVAGSFFNAISGLAVLLAFGAAANHALPWTAFFSPLILLALLPFVLGLTWFLAALGVYLRDVGQLIGNVTMLLMFLSPVFYELSSLPAWLRPYCYANPLTFAIDELRATALAGVSPQWSSLLAYGFCAALVAWLGFGWFQKSRSGFADVL